MSKFIGKSFQAPPNVGAVLAFDGASFVPTNLDSIEIDALDGTFSVRNTADPTKRYAWSLGGMTTGAVLTLAPAQTTSQTLNIPNLTGTDTLATLGLSQSWTGANSFSQQIASTLATGTAPFAVASTTVVGNLNVSQLLGSTWASPAAIGSGTPSTGAFTTLSASGVITSTVSTGTAPFTVASTTVVGNLNVSQLLGSTWAAPAAIGTGTPAAATFTTGVFNTSASVGGAALATFSASGVTPLIQASATGITASGLARFSATAGNSPQTIMAHSRGATIGDYTAVASGDTLGAILFQGSDGTDFASSGQISVVTTGTVAADQVPGIMRFDTANSAGTLTRAAYIDSTQVLIVGGSTAVSSALFNSGAATPTLQIVQGANIPTGASLANFRNAATGCTLYFGKSRSSTIGTMTAVTSADTLGTIAFEGADGTNFVPAVRIIATCTGTIGSTQVPGNLVFQTGTNASPSVLTTALTIDNAQKVTAGAAFTATGVATFSSATDASAVGTAGTVVVGGLSVAKRGFLGTIGSTFSGHVIAGVQDATADTAGAVGEVLTATQSTATNYTSSATYQDITTLSVTPGRWRITAFATLLDNGATLTATANAIFTVATATASATGTTEGVGDIGYISQVLNGVSGKSSIMLVKYVNISTTTTYYFSSQATFTIGNPQFVGGLSAVRMR